jgi:hypothetical protein
LYLFRLVINIFSVGRGERIGHLNSVGCDVSLTLTHFINGSENIGGNNSVESIAKYIGKSRPVSFIYAFTRNANAISEYRQVSCICCLKSIFPIRKDV